MPINYEIFPDKHIVFAKGVGVITAEDVINHFDELSSDTRYTAPMKKIIDHRSI